MRRLDHGILALTVLLSLALVPPPVRAEKAEVDDEQVGRITGRIVCDCGCADLIVRTCGCGRAADMIAEVRGLLEGGNSEQQVFALLEEKYGPTIRAVPRAEGFNLLAWVIPFTAVMLGAVFLVLVVRRLMPASDAEPVPETSGAVDQRLRRRLDREMWEEDEPRGGT